MEMKRKDRTLAGLFLKYVTLFCVNTILLAAGVFVLIVCVSSTGIILPANYAEVQLSENAVQIREAGDLLEQWIPQGCTYGVYSEEGEWLKGDFPQQEQKSAWSHYEKNNIYAEHKGYYRFIPLESGEICIVKYHLIMRYSDESLNKLLPAPELLMPILDIILLILNAVLLSGRFAKNVKIQLQELQVITEKIAGNDLEFEVKTSNLKEINEIMTSFGRMKEALQDSLKAQWDMERQKQEQLSALAHDIKTPLTIIRGNTELLKESMVSEENQECTEYILANVSEIEKYLETMKQVLYGDREEAKPTVLHCELLKEAFQEMAGQIAAVEKIPVSFDIRPSEGTICCDETGILRAWSNIVSNAAEYTNRKKGIEILLRTEYKENQSYLVAAVRDYGTGFSARDLQYADQEFYSGDKSRHDRKHSGLGLPIAKKFVEAQGGFLKFENCKDDEGAVVSLFIRCEGERFSFTQPRREVKIKNSCSGYARFEDQFASLPKAGDQRERKDIEMDVKEQVTKAVEKITKDKKLQEQFQKDPVKALESVLGVDLPDGVVEQVIQGVKAKLVTDKVSGAMDSLKGFIKK